MNLCECPLVNDRYVCSCCRVIHPIKMACGFLVTSVLFMIFCYLTNERTTANLFKKRHPILSVMIILTGGYFIMYMISSLFIFFIGILLPFTGAIDKIINLITVRNCLSILAIFIHASLRLRNIKNKIVNRVENLGLKRTPMGIFLEELGLEHDMF